MNVQVETEAGDRYRWVILAVLWVTYIVVFLNRLGVGPLGAFFKDDLGITSAQVGAVMSVAALGYLLTQLPVGSITDRVGARWPMVIGNWIAGAAMIAVFFAPTYLALLCLVFVTGAGCGFLAPSTTQAVILWFPARERATVMGLKQTAINLGGIVGAATLPIIAKAWGWRAGFVCLGLTAIAAGLLTLVFYRNPSGPVAGTGGAAPQPAASLDEIGRNREIWLVAMGAFFLNWIELAMIGHFVLYMTKSLKVSAIAAGGLLALAEGVGALARPLSGVASDRLFGGRRKPVYLFFAVLSTVMSLVMGLWGPQLGVLLTPAIVLLGIGTVGFGGIYLTMLSEFGGRGGAAKSAAFGSTIAMGGSILGPPAFGYIVDVSGSYETAWLSLVPVGVLSTLSVLFIRESRRKL